ncbi:OLC1v1010925C2 [Oldenlandia corymbosa var. corymbosa]|uniref:OLC1v1010925C2 n=1 Tax=Oldenlandia corymbosa var. corymbosa TaxID=529605 RepID=A0AAV1DVG6_OLDCO|nr:OLC1v1010925C2 [Oldenlandia corymbosa var. corymbosa]
MGSENLYMHQQQLQQQQQLVYPSLPSSSSSASAPRALTLQDWNNLNNSVLGGDELNRYMNEVLPNSREYLWPTKFNNNIDSVVPPSLKTSTRPVDFMTSYVHPQKLMQFENSTTTPPPPKGMMMSLSDSFLKLCDTSNSAASIFNIGNGQEERNGSLIDLNQNLGFNSIENCQPEVFAGLAPPSYMPTGCSSGNVTDYQFPNFFAATNSAVQSSGNMLHLPTNNIMDCTHYEDGGHSDDQPFSGGRLTSSFSGYFHVQHSSHDDSPSNSSNKTSSTLRKDGGRKEKHLKPNHPSTTTTAGVAKKPRVVPPSSSSCPTLKVRKEKLGDRIAALHRMVSPFGKTDTASVLTEAMGYIHFLQDQIQVVFHSFIHFTLPHQSHSFFFKKK